MFDFISTSVPYETRYYIKSQWGGVPAAFGWCLCRSNDRKGARTSRV